MITLGDRGRHVATNHTPRNGHPNGRMDFNPHNVKYAEIERTTNDLTSRKTELAAQLEWYRSIDPKALQNERSNLHAQSTELADTIATIESEQTVNQRDIADTSSLIGSMFNPANWFAEPQVALRRKRKQLIKAKHGIEKRLTATVKSRETFKEKIVDLSSVIYRHQAFKYEETNIALHDVTSRISDAKTALQIAGQRKEHVDSKLKPLLQELRKLKKQKDDAESRLRKAKSLDNDLTNADNSYERAMIHEECEREFGTGSPRSVIRDQQKIIRRADRDHAKAKSRAETIGKKAARVINELVVDGNNMCYEGGKFVGLSVLDTIIPILAREYSIVIVFDSAIRRMLQTEDAHLRKKFDIHAKVHVVATAELADATILELAASGSTTYVLSNDRFADYNEKEAVNQSRVIRHEIVNGKVLVHDLYLNAAYT